MSFPLPGANWTYLHSPRLVATTGLDGFALQNAGPVTVVTWTAPNDGQLHRAFAYSSLVVATLEVGGLVNVSNTAPGGVVVNDGLFPAGSSAGGYAGFCPQVVIPAGGTISVVQFSALTGGAATLWAEIWAS